MIQSICKSKPTNEHPMIMIRRSARLFWCLFRLIAMLVIFSLPAWSILTNITNITNATSQQHAVIRTRSILPVSYVNSRQTVLFSSKSRRSVPDFEATLNAMKCALRMLGLQVSEFHNNMFMCCGLWRIKSYMKQTADKVCENPQESKRVFDDFMTDELIYGKFTHSILGDDTLDCKKYPEGSSTCDRLFGFITFIIVLIFLVLTLLIIGCIAMSISRYRYRKRYFKLLRCKLSTLDQTEKDTFLKDHYKNQKKKQSNFMKNLKTLLPGQDWKNNVRRRDIDSQKPYSASNNNHPNKNSSVFFEQDSITIGTGKTTPDSALPISSSSNADSRNTSMMSLNDAQNQNSQPLPEKP